MDKDIPEKYKKKERVSSYYKRRWKGKALLKENISLNLYDFGLDDEWAFSYDTKTRSKRRDGGTEDTELTSPHEYKKYTSMCGTVLTEN